jgi:quinol-cytochrome oxidoreductase complex cytochrome b subunit
MNLTRELQNYLKKNLTLEDALPTQMPAYVNSMAYLFGVATLSGLVMLILTGVVMTTFGPTWYHVTRIGHFFNSLHFWSVQVFFGSIVLHLVTKFFMEAWRDGRWWTWAVGFVAFLIALFTGLTGFLSQTNWDSQWISVQSKDALNAAGGGSVINPMDTGQMLTLHVIVLPLVIVALVGIHLFLIRRDSPVKPLPLDEGETEGSEQ